MQFQQLPPNRMDVQASGITIFNPRAKPLFERARFWADVYRLWARLSGRSRKLLLLSDVIRSLPSDPQSNNRIQTIPLRLIRGSVDRSVDFDMDFYPLNDALCNRWTRLASMTLQGFPFPPVELIRVGTRYFVVDGHHRISVMRMLHYEDVDAVITTEYDQPSLSSVSMRVS